MPTKVQISRVEWETLHGGEYDCKTAVRREDENAVQNDGVGKFDRHSKKVRSEFQTTIENSIVASGIATKTKKRRVKKVDTKDPNKPKHLVSAYLFFAMEMRQKLKAAGLDASGKGLGERWRSISSEERRRFDAMAVEDSERYYREIAAYNDKRLNAIIPPTDSAATGLV